MMRFTVGYILPALFTLFIWAGCDAPGGLDDKSIDAELEKMQPEEPEVAKEFELPDLDGATVKLSSFKGNIVLVNFWATWCPPCTKEMPSFEKLHQRFKDSGFRMIAIGVDSQGAEIIKPFVEENKLTFTMLVDSSRAVADQYGVFALPTTFLIDRDGTVIDKIQGGADWYSEKSQEYFDGLINNTQSEEG